MAVPYDITWCLVFVFRDIKLIILGDTNVGKTCLIQRYLTGEFAETVTVSDVIRCIVDIFLNKILSYCTYCVCVRETVCYCLNKVLTFSIFSELNKEMFTTTNNTCTYYFY